MAKRSIDIKRFRVPPGRPLTVEKYNPAETVPFENKTGARRLLNKRVRRLYELTELLSLEKVGKSNLEDSLASLRANLATTESERDAHFFEQYGYLLNDLARLDAVHVNQRPPEGAHHDVVSGFSICASRRLRWSSGVLSTYTSGGTP